MYVTIFFVDGFFQTVQPIEKKLKTYHYLIHHFYFILPSPFRYLYRYFRPFSSSYECLSFPLSIYWPICYLISGGGVKYRANGYSRNPVKKKAGLNKKMAVSRKKE